MNLTRIFALASVSLVLSTFAAAAQSGIVRFTNKWKPNEQIHIQNGPIASSPAQPNWWSADWIVEPVPGGQFFRIKNRWRGTYIHNQTQPLEVGPIQPGWWSAQWSIEQVGGGFVRIRNRWKGTYINNQNGAITTSAVQDGWWSAQWRMTGTAPNMATNTPRASGSNLGVAASSPAGRALTQGIGEQCVGAGWPRKFVAVGYAAKVRWYYPTDIVLDPQTNEIKLRPGAKPAKEDNIHNPFDVFTCIDNGQKMLAQVNVIGAEWANDAIALAAGTVVSVASGVAGAVACVGTAGAACPAAAAGIGAAVSGSVSAVTMALPDPKTIAYFGSPKNVILSGTIWKPKWKEMR